QGSASPSFDARSTALSYCSQRIYQQLGLWSQLAPHDTPIHHIHGSDHVHMSPVRLDSDNMQVEALGQVIENRHLGEVLMAALTQAQDIDYLCPASIVSARHTESGMSLEVVSEASGKAEVEAAGERQMQQISASL